MKHVCKQCGRKFQAQPQAKATEHRLLVGDSTQAPEVAKAMGGRKAALFATDPPYLVDYTGADRPNDSGKDWSDSYHEIDIRDAEAFLLAVFTNAAAVCRDNAAWYCWHAHKRAALIDSIWARLGVLNHEQIVWVKPLAVHTYSFWPWRHEPCLMGWKQGHKPDHDGDNSHALTTVWECDWEGTSRPVGNAHPTEKPVELFRRPMRKHTKPGEVCFEPCLGSGTQMVAAEQTGRLCVGIEISTAYAAVALERLSVLGLNPRCVDA